MPLSESQRNRIAQLKVRIEGVRKDIDNLKKKKKYISERYANLIKGTKDSNSKRTYRQYKINETNSVANDLLRKKDEIARIKDEIARTKR